MNATNRLLDMWWGMCKPETSTAAGKMLGVSGQSIANYRSGLSQAKPKVIEKMALDIGENPVLWALTVEAERSRDGEDRRTWERLAKSVAAAAVLAIAILPIGAVLAKSSSAGKPFANQPLAGPTAHSLYIM